MKKLLLIRHAKAVHDDSYNDFERPLKSKGVEDATAMAERLKTEAIVPQLLVTSPSIRTQATADIFSEHLLLSRPTQDKKIYDASQRDLISIINGFKDEHDYIGLVGHNPGIAEMVYYFTGEFRDVSPGSVALIVFEFDEWKLLSKNTGTLSWFGSPKDQ